MISVRQINENDAEKAKNTPLITYKRVVLARALFLILKLALFLNLKQKWTSCSYNFFLWKR